MEDSTAGTKPADEKQQRAKTQDDHSVYCPNCSSRLEPLKCKLLCKKCGYFMSCADYY